MMIGLLSWWMNCIRGCKLGEGWLQLSNPRCYTSMNPTWMRIGFSSGVRLLFGVYPLSDFPMSYLVRKGRRMSWIGGNSLKIINFVCAVALNFVKVLNLHFLTHWSFASATKRTSWRVIQILTCVCWFSGEGTIWCTRTPWRAVLK